MQMGNHDWDPVADWCRGCHLTDERPEHRRPDAAVRDRPVAESLTPPGYEVHFKINRGPARFPCTHALTL